MMLHRRRAIVAQVIGEFFGGLGRSFTPYLENRAPQAPATVARELEISKAAGDMAESLHGSVPPPLLFERALLADMEGRPQDAQANLDELLKAYPGFLAAATACGALSLAANDPGRAIRSFACVETELANTREGAALLADALRAIGMHQSASRYDLATLTCPGHADSRGNDCAPVDMFGVAARDAQMPAAVIIGELPDGRLLCNDRGLYYAQRLFAEQYWVSYRRIGRRILQKFRLLLYAGSKLLEGPMDRLYLAFAERGWPFPGAHVALDGKDRKAHVHVSVDDTHGNHRARKSLGAKFRGTLEKLLSAFTSAGLWGLRIANNPRVRRALYRSYKRLPESVRYRLNRHVLSPVRRLTSREWQQIPEQDWQSKIYRERVRIGVARMLQPRVTLRPVGFESVVTIAARDGDDASRSPDDTYGEDAVGMSVETYRIPPAAAEIFNDLVHQQENETVLSGRIIEE